MNLNEKNQIMICTKGLGKNFGGIWAIKGLNLSVKRGEIFGMVGPDGAGKTTTIRILAGILEPSEGEVWIGGYEMNRDLLKVKEKIGYMPQRFGLYDDLTVMENIMFFADLYDVAAQERPKRIDTLLSFSDLHQFKLRRAGELSGGMKQKLGLVCALIHKPELLLLDEPTCGVDPISRREFWRILYGLKNEGVTIFLSTSYLDEAERCNRIALIHRGEIIVEGSPEMIKEIPTKTTLELKIGDPRKALYQIKSMPGVLQVKVHGEGLHIVLDREKTKVDIFLKAMMDSGYNPEEIRSVLPALEDVFVSIIKKEDDRRRDG
jgi:ABC-2 type transport system ATP-binding protein